MLIFFTCCQDLRLLNNKLTAVKLLEIINAERPQLTHQTCSMELQVCSPTHRSAPILPPEINQPFTALVVGYLPGVL